MAQYQKVCVFTDDMVSLCMIEKKSFVYLRIYVSVLFCYDSAYLYLMFFYFVFLVFCSTLLFLTNPLLLLSPHPRPSTSISPPPLSLSQFHSHTLSPTYLFHLHLSFFSLFLYSPPFLCYPPPVSSSVCPVFFFYFQCVLPSLVLLLPFKVFKVSVLYSFHTSLFLFYFSISFKLFFYPQLLIPQLPPPHIPPTIFFFIFLFFLLSILLELSLSIFFINLPYIQIFTISTDIELKCLVSC